MQVSRILAYPKKAQTPKIIGYSIRIGLLLLGSYFIFQQFEEYRFFLLDQISNFKFNWGIGNAILLILVLLMMPINWLLETKKWQLIGKKNGLTLKEALKGVLLGISMNNFMPLGTGTVAGRLLLLKNEDRMNYVPILILTQWLQTGITISFGTIGIYMVFTQIGTSNFFQLDSHWLLICLGLIVVLLTALILLRRKYNISELFKPLQEFPIQSWVILLTLSITRYLIFLSQFVLLVAIFSPEIGVSLVVGCATWMFVARTIIPRLSNIETLGIRGASAFYFCYVFNLNFAGIMLAIVVLWFINLLIPSIIGFLMLKKIHWQTQKNPQ